MRRNHFRASCLTAGFLAGTAFTTPLLASILDIGFDLSTLDGSNGAVFHGVDSDDQSGYSVKGIGDFNGDGLSDFIIGAPKGLGALNDESDTGEAYVVFGSATLSSGNFRLSSLDGTNGFVLYGIDGSDDSAADVAGAGDINGDGLADLLIGASDGDGPDNDDDDRGEVYVLFGTRNPFGPTFFSSSLNGTNGFTIYGVVDEDETGGALSGAGDLNGDGYDDFLIGADEKYDSMLTAGDFGQAYVVFGKPSFPSQFFLSNLPSADGFSILPTANQTQLGFSVSGAGDVNGDGFSDLVLGAPSNYNPSSTSGESYVVFGSPTFAQTDLVVSNLNGTNGFTITSDFIDAHAGFSVSTAGDVNGDGFADVMIGAPVERVFLNSPNPTGGAFIIFGNNTAFAPSIALSSLDGTNGFAITRSYLMGSGSDRLGNSVSAAGDINGDGFSDLLVGVVNSYGAGGFLQAAGSHYVVYGKQTFGATLPINPIGFTDGFVSHGSKLFEYHGYSNSGAGDVNGDGIADFLFSSLLGDDTANSRFQSGNTYLIYGTASSSTAVSKSFARPGDAPKQGVGELGNGSNKGVHDSRVWIDFEAGDNGSGGASQQTVTLTRSRAGISGIANIPANVVWQIESDRTDESSEVCFRYTDAEVAGIAEASLQIIHAPTLSGPWELLSNQSIDTDNNQLCGKTDHFSYFALLASLGASISTIPNGAEQGPASVTITFSEAVNNFDATDLSLSTNGTGSLTGMLGVTPGVGVGEFILTGLETIQQNLGTTETWSLTINPSDIIGDTSGLVLEAPVVIEFTLSTDAIAASIENAAPNAGDGNLDSVQDADQPNVASVQQADTTYITVAAPAGTNISALTVGSPTNSIPGGTGFPEGVLDLEISNGPTSGTIPVDIIYHSPQPGNFADFYVEDGSTYSAFVPAVSIDQSVTSTTVHLLLSDN